MKVSELKVGGKYWAASILDRPEDEKISIYLREFTVVKLGKALIEMHSKTWRVRGAYRTYATTIAMLQPSPNEAVQKLLEALQLASAELEKSYQRQKARLEEERGAAIEWLATERIISSQGNEC
jgi:hypothetical protein